MSNSNLKDQMIVIKEKLNDLMTEGFVAETSPEEAELMGAFVESALTEDEAKESQYD